MTCGSFASPEEQQLHDVAWNLQGVEGYVGISIQGCARGVWLQEI